jgi:hypothetical protein
MMGHRQVRGLDLWSLAERIAFPAGTQITKLKAVMPQLVLPIRIEVAPMVVGVGRMC